MQLHSTWAGFAPSKRVLQKDRAHILSRNYFLLVRRWLKHRMSKRAYVLDPVCQIVYGTERTAACNRRGFVRLKMRVYCGEIYLDEKATLPCRVGSIVQ